MTQKLTSVCAPISLAELIDEVLLRKILVLPTFPTAVNQGWRKIC
jgi:hypothetical protein